MLCIEITGFIFIFGATVVDSSPVSCVNGMERAERCLSPFQHHLEKGVAEFVSLSDRDVADACLSYDVASKCVVYLLYVCSDVKQKYKAKLDQFEYACSHLTDKDVFWPFMPEDKSYNTSAASNVISGTESELMLSATVKATIAGLGTFLLILICVIAEVITKCRVKRRVQKAKYSQGEQDVAMVAPSQESSRMMTEI